MRTKLALTVLLAASCFGAAKNQVAPQEASDGWISLFDGETLFGWQAGSGAKWSVGQTGIRVRGAQPGVLVTTSPFGDFHLVLNFNPAFGSKVTLGLRCDARGACAKSVPLTGALNKWHTAEVRLTGDKTEPTIDGIAVEASSGSAARAGFIQITVESPEAESTCEFAEIKLQPTGLKAVNGWQSFPGKDAFFALRRDGAIRVEGGPSQLTSKEQFSNVIVQFDALIHTMRSAPVNHSYVRLRSKPDVLGSGYGIVLDNRYKDKDVKKPTAGGTGGIEKRQDAREIKGSDLTPMTITAIANGRHLATWVNGYQQTDWIDEARDAPLSGSLGLQAVENVTNVEFRKIRVQELP